MTATETVRRAGRSVFEFDKQDVVESVRACRARTLALLEDIPEADWERTITPGWRLREVAGHLVSTDEAALNGRLLLFSMKRRTVEELEAWNDRVVSRWADRPIPALLDGLDRWGRRIARLLAIAPAPVLRRSVPGPSGTASLLWLGMMRVYDEWVHMEDVRRTFSFPADDSPEAVAPVVRQLFAGIPYQTLPRIPHDVRGRVALALTDMDLPDFVVDLQGRRFGLGLAGWDARVAGRVRAVAMVAAGRDPWREAEVEGHLVIEGAREPAEAFLDALLMV